MFRYESRLLRFANGIEAEFERIVPRSDGAVMVVPLRDPETVLLVREYAAGVHEYQLGLPKGRLEHGENILDAANRELQEEIGMAAGSLAPLAQFTVAPGFMGNATHVVVARELYHARLEGDEPEPLEVVPWRLDALDTLFAREDFSEPRATAALLMLDRCAKAVPSEGRGR